VLGALVGAVCGLALNLAFSSGKSELVNRLRTASPSGVCLYALIGVCTISAQMFMIASMRYIKLSVATLVTLCTPILVFPLGRRLFKNNDSPVRRYTPAGQDLDAVFDVRAIFQ
jgi:drug/metabolite transporter (DMT)-like permease